LPYSADDDTGRFLIDPASAAALHPLRRRGPASGRPALQPPLPRRRPDHPGARLCDLVDLRQPDRRGADRGRPDHAAHPGVTGCVHRDRAMRSPLAWTHQRARRTQRAPGGRAFCCLERKVEFRPATFRLRDGCSQSDWMAPVGSGLLTLGDSSVQTDPDGSRPIVWMIKRMIKGCPTESDAKPST
jgi:hypothetical protein